MAAYAAEHLEKKARAGKVTRDWIVMAELFIRRAVGFFGAARDLESIGVTDVQAWVTHLSTVPSARGTSTQLGYGTPTPISGPCGTPPRVVEYRIEQHTATLPDRLTGSGS